MDKNEVKEKAASAMVGEAEQAAKSLIDAANRNAARMMEQEENDKRQTKVIAEALRGIFGEYEDSRRFIDVKRIPLICQNINVIHDNIKEIKEMVEKDGENYVTKEQFAPYRSTLNIVGGALVLALVGAVVSLILIK